MANEYLVNSADLTSVANAIREKGETTEQLVFPSDFVTAIQAIKGGGDLNFEIVGGTTQPTNPKENTIWVNTPNEITGWYLHMNRPADPIDGMVWIQTRDTGLPQLNIVQENTILLSIESAKQYDDDTESWVMVDVSVYQNGQWIPTWDGTLYNNGEEYAFVTGGWSGSGIGNYGGYVVYAGTLNPSNITLTAKSSGVTGIATKNKINLDGVDYIEFEHSTPPRNAVVMQICTSLSDPQNTRVAYVVATATKTRIPVTNYRGEHYIYAHISSSASSGKSISITAVRLIYAG